MPASTRERWSARRALTFMVAVSLAFWLGMAAAVLLLIPASAKRAPTEWEKINAQVNTVDRRFAPLATEGDADSVFDCEDYAWTKYHALAALGVAKDQMRLYAVTVANGARHMILVVDGWVFDNLEPRLEPEAKARRYYKGPWDDRTDPGVVIVVP